MFQRLQQPQAVQYNKYIHMFDTDSAWHNSTWCSLETFSQGVPGPSRYSFSTPSTGGPGIPSRRDYVNVGLLILWFDRGWTSLTRYEGSTF